MSPVVAPGKHLTMAAGGENLTFRNIELPITRVGLLVMVTEWGEYVGNVSGWLVNSGLLLRTVLRSYSSNFFGFAQLLGGSRGL